MGDGSAISETLSQESEWSYYSDEGGSLRIPRAQMPQIKRSDRGDFLTFLSEGEIETDQANVSLDSLKPTREECSRAKAQKRLLVCLKATPPARILSLNRRAPMTEKLARYKLANGKVVSTDFRKPLELKPDPIRTEWPVPQATRAAGRMSPGSRPGNQRHLGRVLPIRSPSSSARGRWFLRQFACTPQDFLPWNSDAGEGNWQHRAQLRVGEALRMRKGRRSPQPTSTMMSQRLVEAAERQVDQGVMVRNPESTTGYDFSPSEMDKRRLGAQRLKQVFGKLPGYAKKAERQGDAYWLALYASGYRVTDMP